MSIDEFASLSLYEGERLMRIADDVWSATMADGFRRTPATIRDEKATRQLLDRWEETWNRLAADGEFVLDLARRLGEAGLEAGVGRAAVASEDALASFRDIAQREGGVLPLVENRLRDLDTTWPAVRAGLRRERDGLGQAEVPVAFIEADAGTLMCVGGALLIVAGVGLAVLGAELAAGFALVVGVVAVASAC